jgi:uracil-DNA glycosylase
VPAPMMPIGEQPGDKEDLSGKSFIGPAGMKLNQALTEAGADFFASIARRASFCPRKVAQNSVRHAIVSKNSFGVGLFNICM